MRILALLLALAVVACSQPDGDDDFVPADTGGTDVADASTADAGEDAAADAATDGSDTADAADVGDADTATDTGGDCFTAWGLGEEALVIDSACAGARAVLHPAVSIDGTWSEPACVVEAGAMVCADDAVTLRVTVSGDTARVTVEATNLVVIDGVALQGRMTVPGADAWLSNGFQSWSQTGVIAIRETIPDADLNTALHARGDAEVVRDGDELSWFYTFVGGGGPSAVLGATSAEVFRPWVQVTDAGDHLNVRLVDGGTGEAVSLGAGDSVAGADWFVAFGEDLEADLRRYARATNHRTSDAEPEPGWNSWYELWDGVDADAVLANADLARDILGPQVPAEAPPLRIVIDDGWQVAWGDWQPNEKFPDGLDGLAAELHADGYEVGVWLAPFLVHEDAAIATEHPDWFVAGATYNHAKNGRMLVLDPTHPDAAAHLHDVIETIVGWGLDFLKIDFLFAGTYDGVRAEDVTGMEAFAEGMAIIREAAGEDTVLLAVGAPPMATFPYVDGWRVGPDIALENFDASWFFVPSQARTLAGRWMFCDIVLCDADPVLLRGLTEPEVELGAWTVAFSGGALFLSDDLRVLAEERRSWGLSPRVMEASLSGAASVPLDPFDIQVPPTLSNAIGDHIAARSTHQVPALWRLPSGERVGANFLDAERDIGGVAIPGHSAVVIE